MSLFGSGQPASTKPRWKWSVSLETATVAKGTAETKATAELIAVAVHVVLVVEGHNPDKLSWHVEAVAS